jgi:hypothetical protein
MYPSRDFRPHSQPTAASQHAHSRHSCTSPYRRRQSTDCTNPQTLRNRSICVGDEDPLGRPAHRPRQPHRGRRPRRRQPHRYRGLFVRPHGAGATGNAGGLQHRSHALKIRPLTCGFFPESAPLREACPNRVRDCQMVLSEPAGGAGTSADSHVRPSSSPFESATRQPAPDRRVRVRPASSPEPLHDIPASSVAPDAGLPDCRPVGRGGCQPSSRAVSRGPPRSIRLTTAVS